MEEAKLDNSRSHKVLARRVTLAVGSEIERPSNDLLDDTAVQVDARAELRVPAGHGGCLGRVDMKSGRSCWVAVLLQSLTYRHAFSSHVLSINP